MEVARASDRLQVPDFSKLFLILHILENWKQNKVSWVVNPDRFRHNDFLLSS
jgi:hypothetical protein